jgi:hypothetical protein
MRKTFMTTALLATMLFGIGYVVGQVRGAPLSSAAAAATATATPTTGTSTSPRGGQPDAIHADGTVTAINGDTITVQKDADAGNPNEYPSVTTIVLTGSTQYDAGHDATGSTTATKASIKVGAYILAEGTVSSDGTTLTASRVSLMDHGAPSGGTAPTFNGGNGYPAGPGA